VAARVQIPFSHIQTWPWELFGSRP